MSKIDPDFFKQKFQINHIRDTRYNYIQTLCKSYVEQDKTILHVGCADSPIFNIQDNLHFKLIQHQRNIDGYDVSSQDINYMRSLRDFDGCNLYSKKPNNQYDVLVIPEVIEHVNNVESFIKEMISLLKPEATMVITAPNAFNNVHAKFHIEQNGTNNREYTELVHPDHNYWFSLYTLPNCVKKCVKNINKVFIQTNQIGLLGPKGKEGSVYAIFKVRKA